MAEKNKKSLQEVYQEKSERMMEGIGYWASFYRKNPQRFVKEYLNILDLKEEEMVRLDNEVRTIDKENSEEKSTEEKENGR